MSKKKPLLIIGIILTVIIICVIIGFIVEENIQKENERIRQERIEQAENEELRKQEEIKLIATDIIEQIDKQLEKFKYKLEFVKIEYDEKENAYELSYSIKDMVKKEGLDLSGGTYLYMSYSNKELKKISTTSLENLKITPPKYFTTILAISELKELELTEENKKELINYMTNSYMEMNNINKLIITGVNTSTMRSSSIEIK